MRTLSVLGSTSSLLHQDCILEGQRIIHVLLGTIKCSRLARLCASPINLLPFHSSNLLNMLQESVVVAVQTISGDNWFEGCDSLQSKVMRQAIAWGKDEFLRLRHLFLGLRDVALLAREHHLPALVVRMRQRLLVEWWWMLRSYHKVLIALPEFEAFLKALPTKEAARIRRAYTATSNHVAVERIRVLFGKVGILISIGGWRSLVQATLNRFIRVFSQGRGPTPRSSLGKGQDGPR